MNIIVTSDWLIIVSAAILSLGFSYIPGLRVWFAAKAEEFKQLLMALLILIILIVVFLLQCYSVVETGLVCTVNGGLNSLVIYFLALASNQGTYKVSPKTADVKAIKIAQDRALLKIK